jgi:hypothetical protein
MMDSAAAARRPASPPENPPILPTDTFGGGRLKQDLSAGDEPREVLDRIADLRVRIAEGLNQITGQINGLRKLEEKEKNVYLALVKHLEVRISFMLVEYVM